MSQSNLAGRITIGFAVILAVLIVATARDETREINTITGAYRTQVRYGFFIPGKDQITSNWASESAARQGIATDGHWKSIGRLRTILGMKSRASTTDMPASEELNLLFPNGIVSAAKQKEADELLRKFAAEPDETLRRYLVWDSMLLNQ